MSKQNEENKTVSYKLDGGLNDKQLQKIYKGVVELLETIGVELSHQEILELLSKRDGITIRANRILFSSELIAKHLAEIRKSEPWSGQESGDYRLSTPYYCLNVCDMETGKIRPATTDDLIKAVKLCDSYAMEGSAPLLPGNIQDKLKNITAYKICIENSSGIGSCDTIANGKELEVIYEMGQLVGRKPPYAWLQTPISPLRLNAEALDIIYHNRDKNYIQGVGVSACPLLMAGATTFMNLPYAWIQAAAESISASIVTKLINENIVIGHGVSVFPFDMKYLTMAFGRPEEILYQRISRQIQRYIFGSAPGGNAHSMGKASDIQVGIEKASMVLMGALSGARHFGGAGMSPLDEVFGFEQVVIDVEIMDYVKRIMAGLKWEEDAVSINDFNGVIQSNDFFLTHPTTLQFREKYWMPTLFEYSSLGEWRKEGYPSVLKKAKAIVSKRLLDHCFELDNGVKSKLEKIYQDAAQHLV